MALVPIGVLYLASLVRLIALQGHPGEVDAMERVRTHTVLPASRGSILDRHGRVLAEDVGTWDLVMDAAPKNRYLLQLIEKEKLTPEQAEERVRILADGVGVPFATLWRILMTDSDPYQVVRRGIDPGERETILRTLRAVPWTGLLLQQDFDRRYPNGPVLSHVVGYPNTRKEEDLPQADGTLPGSPGSGLELGLESLLAGEDGIRYAISVSSKHGVDPALNKKDPVPGQSVRTTLDLELSTYARRQLVELMEEHPAERCMALAIHVETGEILAMLGLPDYDPGDPEGSMQTWVNPVTGQEELNGWSYPGIWYIGPGSTFKPLVAAYALERGAIGPEQWFENHGGTYYVPRRLRSDAIDNSIGVPDEPMRAFEGIIESSNVVFAQIAREIGRADMAEMLDYFGYSTKPRTLPGLALPLQPRTGPEREAFFKERGPDGMAYTIPSMGYGQEIELPPLDHAMALASIANGGRLLEPTLDPLAEQGDGKRILDEDVAAYVREAMHGMVMKENRKWLPHRETFAYCGKSGTAMITGGVFKGSYSSLFTAFGPLEDPQVLVLVAAFGTKKADRVGTHHFGSKVCGPAAVNILHHALVGRGALATNPAETLDWRASEARLQRD